MNIAKWISKNGAAVVAFAGAAGTLLHNVYPQFSNAIGQDADAILIVVTFVAAGISAFSKSAEGDSGGTNSGGDSG